MREMGDPERERVGVVVHRDSHATCERARDVVPDGDATAHPDRVLGGEAFL